MQIDILDETQSEALIDYDLFKQLLNFLAEKENINPQAELSVTFVTTEIIQSLNNDYRGLDEPTDVLSFEMYEGNIKAHSDVKNDIPLVLGDIIICLEIAKQQAKTYNHSLNRELGFLLVHGFLHILGYDHQTETAEKEMFALQSKLLEEFGLER